MSIFKSLEDFQKYSDQLNIEKLRDAEPSMLYHFVQQLREKEVDLLRKFYYTELKKSKMDWKENENYFNLNRLVKYGFLKSFIGDEGKDYKFTRLGKKIAKLLVEDYFPFDIYPTQQRGITQGRIYRDYYIKTYYNRKPISTNSIPTEKVGSSDFQTRLIEFTDVIPDAGEIGRVKNIAFKEAKATKILKEKTEKGLKAFRNNKMTRIMRPLLYNRRTDEVVFIVPLNNQSVYVRANNLNIAYLRHKYGEDIKFLVNTAHINKVLFLEGINPPLPIMVLNSKNEPVAIMGNDNYMIKEKKVIREIINSFQRSHEIEDEAEDE